MRFLIIGGGSIGRRHIANLKLLGYTDIYCLKREPDPVFAAEHSVKVITGAGELTEPIDAVIVCSPTSMHLDGITVAAKLNASILMEKPLVDTPSGLKQATAAMQHFKGKFFIGFMLRFHPLLTKIREILASGELGKVYHARFAFGSYLPNWHPYEDHRISYASRKELGGGVINTITHELDLVQCLFGNPDWVFCNAENFGKLDIAVEEMADAIFGFKDKVVTLHLDYLQKDYERSIRVLCEEGNVNWDWNANRVTVNRHKQAPEVFSMESFEVNQLYVDELKAFIQLVKNEPETTALDFEHAVKNAMITFYMHRSAETGKKEMINYSSI